MTRRRLRIWALIAAGMLFLGIVGLLLNRLEEFTRDVGDCSQIEEGLYVGSYAKNPPQGTGAVINLCELEDTYRCKVHIWEPIRDSSPAPSLAWLRQMVEFIDAQRRAGVTTLIHCRNGVSRSGLLVVAYEMFRNHWGRDQALEFVRSKRPIIRPNSAFMQQLLEWEDELTEPT